MAELAEAQEHARRSVASAVNASKAAVAWDGYLTVGGERIDAVFVEASAAGDQSSIILAQRYRSTGRLRKKIERVGNAAVVDQGEPLF